jgi:AmmeMemoRadiSam system protein A
MLAETSQELLLQIARSAIEAKLKNQTMSRIELSSLPEELRADGACFVTLTQKGLLRGCIGSLEARRPLALDVQEHAIDAAFHDFRFPPLSEGELEDLRIEVSVLSKPEALVYAKPEDLPGKLTPGKDGVILSHGLRRATFLPQVWEKIPAPELFLDMLCEKMGADSHLWRRQKLDVMTYQVQCFEEK